MELKEEDLRAEFLKIMDMVWASMLAQPISPTDKGTRPPPPLFTACLQVAGTWEGTMLLECPMSIGRKAAAAMFGMTESETGESETRDAVGELVNMIGGNVKALLPAPSFISLPAVAEGSDYRFTMPGTALLAAQDFECEGQFIRFALFESTRCAAGRRG